MQQGMRPDMAPDRPFASPAFAVQWPAAYNPFESIWYGYPMQASRG